MITRALPAWFFVIAVILVLQTVSATLGRLVPVAGPAFTAEFGWDESWVGYLTAANIVGALFALTAGIGIMRRMGGVRALQWSLLIGAAALLLYLIPSIALALIASACVGLANGTANPAGSEVLTRLTPPAHRNLVFSIKQAGVPLGGVLGGLAIPPLIEAMGWRLAAVVVGSRLHGRDLAHLAVPGPHRSAARATDAAPPGQFSSDRHPGAAAFARRTATGCGGRPGSARCWRSRRPPG